MKKVLTISILFMFCFSQAIFARGTDKVEYKDSDKNIPVSANKVQNVDSKKILSEIAITDETGKIENFYIDNKGNITKVEEGQLSQTKQIIIDSAKENEYINMVQNAQLVLYNQSAILAKYGYAQKDKSSKSKKEYMKMDLLDGDYVIGFNNAPYIAEYHEDGSLMGLVKIDKKVLNDNQIVVAFYEYRVGYNSDTGMGLKHVLFLDYEKDKYFSQYIYNSDGKLLCRQINNDIYVANEARNMILDLSRAKTIEAVIYNEKLSKNNKTASEVLTKVLCAPFTMTEHVILGATVVATAPIWVPCLYFMFRDFSEAIHY